MDPFATAALLAIAQLSMAYMAIQPTPEEVHFKGTMPCFYLTPEQDDFNKIPELQACIAEALYDVDSIVADPEAYTKEELAALPSAIPVQMP